MKKKTRLDGVFRCQHVNAVAHYETNSQMTVVQWHWGKEVLFVKLIGQKENNNLSQHGDMSKVLPVSGQNSAGKTFGSPVKPMRTKETEI